MSSNPNELGPRQSHDAADDIAATARNMPMITPPNADKDLSGLGLLPGTNLRWHDETKDPEGYDISKAMRSLVEVAVTDTILVGTQPEFSITADVTLSHIIKTIKQIQSREQ